MKPEKFGKTFSPLNHVSCWRYAAINSLTRKGYYLTGKLSSTLPSFPCVQWSYPIAMELWQAGLLTFASLSNFQPFSICQSSPPPFSSWIGTLEFKPFDSSLALFFFF